MITLENKYSQIVIYGLSTDEKPIKQYKSVDIKNSFCFYEMDTKKTYIYDEENEQWLDM